MATNTVQVRRVYDPPQDTDGTRVLVDRLWPRGVSKEHAAVDHWLKDVTPSDELRGWYHKDRDRYEAFAKRYRAELRDADHRPAVDELLGLLREGAVTLITSVKDVEHSHVPVLVDHLERRLRATRGH